MVGFLVASPIFASAKRGESYECTAGFGSLEPLDSAGYFLPFVCSGIGCPSMMWQCCVLKFGYLERWCVLKSLEMSTLEDGLWNDNNFLSLLMFDLPVLYSDSFLWSFDCEA
ncbi:hypothetical protein P8452_28448 [Trifolium repens]|nr:hypothetical protein P8452_28448 [Trifolium repens]WJX41030.1 hypothetical protein P8452_28448 [Trifolium repens]